MRLLLGILTAGVISALHRNITLASDVVFRDAIQTDAPINPGNSGGALADAAGKVIGINTAILGGAGGSVGVGFAIPIDIARRVADQLISTGHASLAFIGISGQNLPNGRGALVQEAVSGGPAARGGIRQGPARAVLKQQLVGRHAAIERFRSRPRQSFHLANALARDNGNLALGL